MVTAEDKVFCCDALQAITSTIIKIISAVNSGSYHSYLAVGNSFQEHIGSTELKNQSTENSTLNVHILQTWLTLLLHLKTLHCRTHRPINPSETKVVSRTASFLASSSRLTCSNTLSMRLEAPRPMPPYNLTSSTRARLCLLSVIVQRCLAKQTVAHPAARRTGRSSNSMPTLTNSTTASKWSSP